MVRKFLYLLSNTQPSVKMFTAAKQLWRSDFKFHNYNTRSASNMFYTIRADYGIFNIRFKDPKVLTSIRKNLKTFSISRFKESVKKRASQRLLVTYVSHFTCKLVFCYFILPNLSFIV